MPPFYFYHLLLESKKMIILRRLLINLLIPLVLIVNQAVSYAAPLTSKQIIEGKHYQPLSVTKPIQSGIKFYFWPQSVSCYQLELAINDWHENHPEIVIQRIPLVKRPHWRLLAKAWLVAKSMNIDALLLESLYQAIHFQQMSVKNVDELEVFLELMDIDTLDFMVRFQSHAINVELKTLQNDAKKLPIFGVPTIIINDRWISDAAMATTSEQMILILDRLTVVNP